MTDDQQERYVRPFAAAMVRKLAAKEAEGRSGWEDCNPADLWQMLREHVEKGDPIDIANFCMMLWYHQRWDKFAGAEQKAAVPPDPTITDADVEAAAERVECLTGYDMTHCQEIARAALATTAPKLTGARLAGFEEARAAARAAAHDAVRDAIADMNDCARMQGAVVDAIVSLKPEPDDRPRWRHVKRGTTYTEIGRAELQAATNVPEGALLVNCQGDDGKWWGREVDEFLDGRFAALKPEDAP